MSNQREQQEVADDDAYRYANGNISQTGLQALKIDTPHLSNRNQGLIGYANEYGIPTVSNTIGYYQEEFKPDSPAGRQQIKDGLPFLMV